MQNAIVELDVKSAADRMREGWAPFVLDVRTPAEAEALALPFTDLLQPHQHVLDVVAQLPQDRDILVFCKRGGRSRLACEALAAAGVNRLLNLSGGITAWVEEVSPEFAAGGPMTLPAIRARIEQAMPGALVEVLDMTGGGDHIHVRVISPEFAGRSRIQCHQQINLLFAKEMQAGKLHALRITAQTQP